MNCYINDQFLPLNAAKIGVRDLALLRGYGIFDFFRLVGNKPMFLEEHLDRFFRSAGLVKLPITFSKDSLRNKI